MLPFLPEQMYNAGQRVASIGISLKQYGHFFVVGAAGSSFFCPQ